jgi:hypothetical protein
MVELSSALRELADRRFRIMISADLELQFERGANHAPMKLVLHKARLEAMKALDALILCDPSETNTIRTLQSEVRRYDDLVAWVREIIIEGKEADRALDEETDEELARLMSTAEGRETAQLYGLDDEGSDR